MKAKRLVIGDRRLAFAPFDLWGNFRHAGRWRLRGAAASMIAPRERRPHKGANEGVFMSKLSLSPAWDETRAILARDGRLFVSVALALFVLPGLILNVTMPETVSGEMPAVGPWLAIAGVALLVSLVGQLAVIRLAIGPHVERRRGDHARAEAARALCPRGAHLGGADPADRLGALFDPQAQRRQSLDLGRAGLAPSDCGRERSSASG